MDTSAQQVTAVGYDGSEPARAALRCAPRRVAPGGRLVVGYAAEPPTEFLESAYYEELLQRSRERAARVLEDLVSGLDTDAEVETAVRSGPPAHSLGGARP